MVAAHPLVHTIARHAGVVLIWACSLAAAVAFLWSCWATTTDAQGVFVFIVTLPVIAALLGAAYLGGTEWDNAPATARWGASTALAIGIFVGAFTVCAFVPVLNVFPEYVVGGVAKVFELATGQTPYAYVRAHR